MNIRKIIGQTWFDIEEDGDRILLDTRDHGSIYEERPGKEDIAEGSRIQDTLKAALPDHKVEFECVDEWVHVTVRPKTDRDRAEEKVAALVASVRSIPGTDVWEYNRRVHVKFKLSHYKTMEEAVAAAEASLPESRQVVDQKPDYDYITFGGKTVPRKGHITYLL
jgi:hypothetical protein